MAKRPDVPSPAAHEALTYYGWTYNGENGYTHPDRPGEQVNVWAHYYRPGWAVNSNGVEQLEYHLRVDRDRHARAKEAQP